MALGRSHVHGHPGVSPQRRIVPADLCVTRGGWPPGALLVVVCVSFRLIVCGVLTCVLFANRESRTVFSVASLEYFLLDVFRILQKTQYFELNLSIRARILMEFEY